MNYPEIRIKNAYLLRQNVSVHLHKLWGKGGSELADDKRVDEIVELYRKAWVPYEKKIIHGMCDLLELEFRQNIIDVNIAPWFTAFSDPMVIGVIYEPDRFVDVLTHELIHRLLTDNIQTLYDTEYAAEWKKLYGERSKNELVHIPVHAVLQTVFDDILGEPERTKRDRELCKQWPDYDAAWTYVETNGYKEIIKRLKANYKDITASQSSSRSDIRGKA